MGKSKKHSNKTKKKHKHKERKEKKKKSKNQSKEKRKDKTDKHKIKEKVRIKDEEKLSDDFSIPVELMNKKSHAPETPEEYQKRQSRMRREIDPITGRSRLIKGDGEVMEEIVSKERHKAINREATKGDGEFFQENVRSKR